MYEFMRQPPHQTRESIIIFKKRYEYSGDTSEDIFVWSVKESEKHCQILIIKHRKRMRTSP